MWHPWAASPHRGGGLLEFVYLPFDLCFLALEVLDIEDAKDWATQFAFSTQRNVIEISKMLSRGLTHPVYWRRSPRKTRGALNASPQVADVPQPAAPPAPMPESTMVQPNIQPAHLVAVLMQQ